MIPRLKPYYDHRELLAALSFHKHNSVNIYQQEFAKLFESSHALAFPYGRSALYTIFKALELENNEVILPAYTCVVVANAIVHSGNIPRFIDITLDDYNMNLDLLAEKINENTRAVIATHLFGYPLNTDILKEIISQAEKRFGHKIWIIQDCAHSFGARWDGKLVCNEGDVAIYGLNISKVISSIFGGMTTTNDPALYDRIKKYRDHEFSYASKWKSLKRLIYLMAVKVGFSSSVYTLVNWLEEKTSIIDSLTKYYDETKIELPSDYLEHMLEIEARVGLVQLQKYSDIITKRKAIAEYYSEQLSDIENLVPPPLIEGATYSHYVMRVPDRRPVLQALGKKGIQLGWLIEYSIPEMKAFIEWKEEDYPNSKLCAQSTINLPNWPMLNNKELKRIGQTIIEFFS